MNNKCICGHPKDIHTPKVYIVRTISFLNGQKFSGDKCNSLYCECKVYLEEPKEQDNPYLSQQKLAPTQAKLHDFPESKYANVKQLCCCGSRDYIIWYFNKVGWCRNCGCLWQAGICTFPLKVRKSLRMA